MTRGRKPTPTATKILNGNVGHRPINDAEAKPSTDKPSCPAHLDKVARTEWRRISALLHTAGLLTSIDRTALAGYCVAYSRWIDAEKQIQEKGTIVKSPSGYPMQNPYLTVANKAMGEVRKWLVEFGMTPSSRTRIKVEPPDQADAMEQFLSA